MTELGLLKYYNCPWLYKNPSIQCWTIVLQMKGQVSHSKGFGGKRQLQGKGGVCFLVRLWCAAVALASLGPPSLESISFAPMPPQPRDYPSPEAWMKALCKYYGRGDSYPVPRRSAPPLGLRRFAFVR